MKSIIWTDVVSKSELPGEVEDALRSKKVWSKIQACFVYGYTDDDYTHVVVVCNDGRAFLVEGASLRPTLIKQIS